MRLTGLLLLALLLRILAAGFGGPLSPDGVYYYLPSAQGILDGDLARGFPPTHHPGYPLLIALVQLCGVAAERAALLVSIVAGALTLLPVMAIARRLGGDRAGWLAGGLLVLLPLHVAYSGMVQTEALFTLLVALTLERLLAFAQGARARTIIVAALCGGAAAWVRGEALLMTALLPCAALYRERGARAWALTAVATLLLPAIAATTGITTYRALGDRFAYSPGSNIVFLLGQQQGDDPFDCFFEIAPSGDQLAFYYATTPEGFDPGLRGRYVRENFSEFCAHYASKVQRLALRWAPKGLDPLWLLPFIVGLLLLLWRDGPIGARLLPLYIGITIAGLSAYFVQKRFWIPLAAATVPCTAVGFAWLWARLAGGSESRNIGLRRAGLGVLALLYVGVAVHTIEVFDPDHGWNARVARDEAAELRVKSGLPAGAHLLASNRRAALPYYAGYETSELPVAPWPEALVYFYRRGADAVLVPRDEAQEQQWFEGLEAAGARAFSIGERRYWFLDLR